MRGKGRRLAPMVRLSPCMPPTQDIVIRCEAPFGERHSLAEIRADVTIEGVTLDYPGGDPDVGLGSGKEAVCLRVLDSGMCCQNSSDLDGRRLRVLGGPTPVQALECAFSNICHAHCHAHCHSNNFTLIVMLAARRKSCSQGLRAKDWSWSWSHGIGNRCPRPGGYLPCWAVWVEGGQQAWLRGGSAVGCLGRCG